MKIKNLFLKFKNFSNILFDQIIVSGSNFIISILLIRFLDLEIFGKFSFLWLILLLINSVQLSYIISPMITNAGKQNKNELKSFYGSVILHQIFFSIFISLILFILLNFFGDIFPNFNLKEYSISFTLIVLFSQFYQLTRRLLFCINQTFKALVLDITTYSILIFALIYFNFYKGLNINLILWLFNFVYLFGVILNFKIFYKMKYKIHFFLKNFTLNWKIAKWLLYTSIIQWFSNNLWVINSGFILGAKMLGIIRACQTIIGISNIFYQSFENLIPTIVTKKLKTNGIKAMLKYLKEFRIISLSISIVLSFVLILLSEQILRLFYGHEISKFNEILSYLSLIIPLYFFTLPYVYGFRTMQNTKPIFISYLLSSIVALTISNYIITNYDIRGYIFGTYLSQIIIILILTFYFRKIVKKFL
tara:strand:+ start:24 stop:1280 length:1257 start_codon:yes stop_codon:yes gene_type:complete